MALARDVHFSDYDSNGIVAGACADLSALSDYRAPQDAGAVTPSLLFRGNTPGDLAGPYVSQFLLKKVPYGSLSIGQRQQTAMPGVDYMTDFDSWLAIQSGANPLASDAIDPAKRFIRNGRDLAAYVHVDALYEAYLNACLILLGMGAPVDAGNPYATATKTDAFGTFGGPHILSLVTEVATRALKAVWFQKWYVHRRLRPEEFGGRVHQHLVGAENYPIDSEILDSQAVQEIFGQFGTYLLPQAYPEGSPLHPAYGSGHATVAGACVTVLKAWFDESYELPDPVVANADGSSLEPYNGADALTVGGELNKLAANIATARNFAGIHWRTDYWESVKLGEAVALGILRDQRKTYMEDFHGFTLTKFDGSTDTI
jgi:membrane-associated phospholipid phosphatase